MKRNVIMQYAVLAAIAVFGCFSVVLIFGEDNPRNPLSILELIALKGVGAFALFGLYNTCVWLKAHDMIPKNVLAFIAWSTREDNEDGI